MRFLKNTKNFKKNKLKKERNLKFIKMSDSDSDEEVHDKYKHVTGPVEDAWKMKIPQFKPDDNKNGKQKVSTCHLHLS